MAAPHGHFYWNELNTRDAKKAIAFYGETIGWSFDEMEMEGGDTYYLCMDGDTIVAGIFTMSGPDFEGIPEHWFSYVAVDDVDARLAKVTENGGTIIRPSFDVPGTGRIAIAKDINGATLGWMTPSE